MSKDGEHGLGDVGDRVKEMIGSTVGMASASLMGSSSAAAYVANAGISDSYVIEAARIAQAKTTSPEIRELAERLERDHTSSRAALRRDAERHEDDTPYSLDQRRKGLLDILERTEPKDFDGVFLHQMLASHTEALTVHTGFAAHGDDPQYRQLATAATPALQSHFALIKDLTAKAAGRH
jgi:putative membrane protein